VPPYLQPDDAQKLDPAVWPVQPAAVLPVSAKNQMNIEYLKETLVAVVVGKEAPLENAVAINARHYEALHRADLALADVLAGLSAGISGEWIAQDLRQALSCLGEITGEVGAEDVLGSIFSRFCIGK